MEIEYACSVKNRFSAIKDSTDPFEAALASRAAPPPAKAEKKKRTKPSSPVTTPPAVAKPTSSAAKPTSSVAKPSPKPSPPKRQSPPKQPSPTSSPPQAPHQEQQRTREPRRPGEFGEMTFHRGRGNRRPYVPQRPPLEFNPELQQRTSEFRRPFGRFPRGGQTRRMDRHSSSNKTSIKPEEKRQGGGARNWGRKDEIPPPPPSKEASPVAEEVVEEETVETEERPASPVEMTYEEYAASVEASKLHRPNKEQVARKAGEGENPNKWAKPALIIQKKKPATTKTEGEIADEPACHQPNRNAEIESAVRNMFALKPVDQRRGRGGFRRGNGDQVYRRGGFRGGSNGGGGYRGQQPFHPHHQQQQPRRETIYDLKNEDEFPKLA